MDSDDKEILRKILDISEENNKSLHSIQRTMFWQKVFRYAYWAIIIGAGIGLFYFLQPYIDQVMQVYSDIRGGVNGIFQ